MCRIWTMLALKNYVCAYDLKHVLPFACNEQRSISILFYDVHHALGVQS